MTAMMNIGKRDNNSPYNKWIQYIWLRGYTCYRKCFGNIGTLDRQKNKHYNTDTLFMVTNTSPLCGVQAYALQTINLDAYADGNAHKLLFYGHTFSSTNFFIDDVSVITCPITTGIKNVYPETLISISPNPVKDKLKISFKALPVTPTKIDITNMIGQSVYNHTLSIADQNDFYIDVAGLLEEGIYIVILTSGDKIFTQKLIVH